MIGRWLCRMGWHRWSYHVGADVGVTTTTVTMARCSRKKCPRAGQLDLIEINR